MNTPLPHSMRPVASQASRGVSIGSMLLEMGKITPDDAERILLTQKEFGMRFGEAALHLNLITQADIDQVLSRQFDYPYLQKGSGTFPVELVAAYQPFTPQVEALRAIRSQLMLGWFARGQKSLAIVSVDQGDGASCFAANLAVVFSQLGERTLLIDANLRRPRQQQIFGLKGNQGLSDMLAGRADDNLVSKIDSFVDLSVLAAGTLPPNPQELLSRDTFGIFNNRIGEHFEIVLYDVPACSGSADAMAIAARVGGVLLVTRRNKTRVADINAVAEQFAANGAEVVGTVIVNF